MSSLVIYLALFVGAAALVPIGILVAVRRSERKAIEQLRAGGTRCTAFVKSYRRVSMTQHRVLFEIRLPTGAIGREYMLANLSDPWLADVTALHRPVEVCAHPDARTILIVT